MSRFRRVYVVALSILMLAVFSFESAPVLGVEAEVSTTDRPLSFVIEEGFTLPEQVLLQDQEAKRVRFTIRGDARFLVNHGKKWAEESQVVRRVDGGKIVMPSIKAGQLYDESFVQILLDGRQLLDDLRVATIPVGYVRTIVEFLQSSPEALASSGEHFAIVNESLVDFTAPVPHPELHPDGIHYYMPIPGTDGDDGGGDKIVGGAAIVGLCLPICIRTFLPPGLVKWQITNPTSFGYKVLPESGPVALIAASYPQQAIDAIYNYSYPYGVAAKVAGSCTATIGSSPVISCCCNYAALLFGHTCRWVNAQNEGWPILQ